MEWAENHVVITPEEKNIIKQSKKSFLFTGNTPWIKKGDVNFDVGMGAFDGAETCDLIGLYMLHILTTQIKDLEGGLYRDDGLCVTDATPRLTEKLKQKLVNIFKKMALAQPAKPTSFKYSFLM